MLDVRELRKAFGALVAVDGVSFRIEKGQAVGLLGPNGAGKTTTVSIVCGLLPADRGEVRLEGRPLRGDTDPAKRKLGLVPQDIALYDDLTARDNLRLFGALYDLGGPELKAAIASAMELVGLADRAGDLVKTYSGGMKRRLNLAAALLHDPDLLILDEPTVGVDPQSRNAIFENLQTLRARGKSLLYTTHYMEEAERLCERIVIMDHGHVVADDDLRGLYRLLPASNRIAIELAEPIPEDDGAWLDELRGLDGVAVVQGSGVQLNVGVADLTATMPRVLSWLADRGRPFVHAVTERPSLETVFLHLTGRSLRDP
jgi:ABC-2 type transport system ATP-binding protein